MGSSKNWERNFNGYRITCIESNLPLGLETLISLDVLKGGIDCDNVSLQVKVGHLISLSVGVKIYGVKVSPDHQFNQLTCKNSIQIL